MPKVKSQKIVDSVDSVEPLEDVQEVQSVPKKQKKIKKQKDEVPQFVDVLVTSTAYFQDTIVKPGSVIKNFPVASLAKAPWALPNVEEGKEIVNKLNSKGVPYMKVRVTRNYNPGGDAKAVASPGLQIVPPS